MKIEGAPGSATRHVELPAGTQSIARMLAVLELCAESDGEVGIPEISRTCELTPATAYRIVRALQVKGYLAQNPVTEKYSLGRAALVLGVRAGLQLGLSAALNHLVQMRDACDETINLGARVGNEMEVLIQAESRQALRISQHPGNRLPVFATSMGKVALALGTRGIEREVRDLAGQLWPVTSSTITSAAQLERELVLIAERGHAVDDGEAHEGARCVSVPVLSPEGRLLCAIAVQGPVVRMPFGRCDELAADLKRLAVDIAATLPASRPLGG